MGKTARNASKISCHPPQTFTKIKNLFKPRFLTRSLSFDKNLKKMIVKIFFQINNKIPVLILKFKYFEMGKTLVGVESKNFYLLISS